MRRHAVAPVIEAVVTTLRASSGVTDLVSSTGIYNNVPQGAAFPYVVVTSPSDRRVDTFGRFGAETLIDVKAVSQAFGDKEAAEITDYCLRALDFQEPTTTGHTALGCAWENSERYQETVNGIITRHHVATYRVWTEQSTT